FIKGETLGKLEEKQEIVKRQLSRKFGLSREEAEEIDRIENPQALDAALDEIIDAADKRQVLEKLGL
ncbi:MAG: hypothetical protein ACLFNZ_01170, partial [Spirochaetaceae bacterium]